MYRGANRLHVKRIKKWEIIYLLLFLVAWILFGFNTKNADYKQYELAYNSYSLDAHGRTNEIGFRLLCALFKRLGFSYQGFIIVFSFVGLAVLFKSIKDYTDLYCAVALFYLIYPFLFDITQIRMFAVEVIVTYAIRFLGKLNRKNVISYLVCILLAITFHSTGIMYAMLMLAYLKDKKAIIRVSGIVTGGLVMISLFANNIVNRVIQMFSFLGENWRGGGWDTLYSGPLFVI